MREDVTKATLVRLTSAHTPGPFSFTTCLRFTTERKRIGREHEMSRMPKPNGMRPTPGCPEVHSPKPYESIAMRTPRTTRPEVMIRSPFAKIGPLCTGLRLRKWSFFLQSIRRNSYHQSRPRLLIQCPVNSSFIWSFVPKQK